MSDQDDHVGRPPSVEAITIAATMPGMMNTPMIAGRRVGPARSERGRPGEQRRRGRAADDDRSSRGSAGTTATSSPSAVGDVRVEQEDPAPSKRTSCGRTPGRPMPSRRAELGQARSRSRLQRPGEVEREDPVALVAADELRRLGRAEQDRERRDAAVYSPSWTGRWSAKSPPTSTWAASAGRRRAIEREQGREPDADDAARSSPGRSGRCRRRRRLNGEEGRDRVAAAEPRARRSRGTRCRRCCRSAAAAGPSSAGVGHVGHG